jgi:hypothetical protein
VEEGKAQKHLFPLLWLLAFFETGGIESSESSKQIIPEPSRRLVGHFDALHEDGDGEDIGRHTSQPNSEIPVDIFSVL